MVIRLPCGIAALAAGLVAPHDWAARQVL